EGLEADADAVEVFLTYVGLGASLTRFAFGDFLIPFALIGNDGIFQRCRIKQLDGEDAAAFLAARRFADLVTIPFPQLVARSALVTGGDAYHFIGHFPF